MKKLLSLTLCLIMLLAFTACGGGSDSEPPAPDVSEESSPYADNDYSKRYYMANTGGYESGVIYGDNYYYTANDMSIKAIPLSEVGKHNILEEGVARAVPVSTPLCLDPLCVHKYVECPAMMRSLDSGFLIDAHESNGEQPIIYYHRSVGEVNMDVSLGHEIIRFDVGKGETKQLVSTDAVIKQLMAYGDCLYYTTLTSKDEVQICTIAKTGGDPICLDSGAATIMLIGANEQGAYFNDDQGYVYFLSLDGMTYLRIYSVSEYYVLGHPGRGAAELNMMVYGDYLYYFADYQTRELPYGNGTENFNDHSIRRVNLNDLSVPSAEGEMVAESVYDTEVYGIYNGVLYYAPFDVRTQLNGGNDWTHSNGTINGVNLETLENFTVISDCGFDSTVHPYYVNDRCMIGQMSPYRDMNGLSPLNGFWGDMLLDFETGAVYCVEGEFSS